MKKGPEAISSGTIELTDAGGGNVLLSSCGLGGRDAAKRALQEESLGEAVIDPNFKYCQGSDLFSWYQPEEPTDFNPSNP